MRLKVALDAYLHRGHLTATLLLPSVWSRDEDGFGDASGEPGDKLGGTNMFPSPYSVWPKNILQFAEYAGSNIMNPRVTLNTQHFCLNIQSEQSDPDTRHRNQEPFLPFYIMISTCPVSGPIPCLALPLWNSNTQNIPTVIFPQDLERPN